MKRKLNIVENLILPLDKHCKYLLFLLSVEDAKNKKGNTNQKGFGFNELYHYLQQLKKRSFLALNFTRPTLAKHLNHLVEGGFLEKTVIKKSNLKLKPTKYRISKFWRELTQVFYPWVNFDENKAMKTYSSYNTKILTSVILYDVLLCFARAIKNCLEAPPQIQKWFLENAFYLQENLTQCYIQIIKNRDDIEQAQKFIDTLTNLWACSVNKKLNEREEMKEQRENRES